MPVVSITQADRDEQTRRYFVLGVKTLAVPFQPFKELFHCDPREVFHKEFNQLEKWKFATMDDESLILTDLGCLFVDTISSLFFSDREQQVPHPEEPEIRAVELARRAAIGSE